MVKRVRQSLLAQMLGGFLLFVAILAAGGLALISLVQRQMQDNVQVADLALANAMALEASNRMEQARQSVAALAGLGAVQQGDLAAMERAFAAFKAARPDLDRVYWIDAGGIMQV